MNRLEESAMDEKSSHERLGLLKTRLLTWRDTLWKNLIAPLSFSNSPPWFDARGVAIGLLVGLGVPIGAHTLILGLLLVSVRFNFPIAFAVTWIVNPFTVIPMYYGYYAVGSVLLGCSPSMGMDGFREMMEPVLDAGNFLQALKLFVLLDFRILERWMVAAVLFSTVSAALGYIAAYAILTNRKNRKSPSGIIG